MLALLESAPDAIWVVDDLGTILFANPVLERLTGLSREELQGADSRRLLADPSRGDAFATELLRSASALPSDGFDAELRGASGDVVCASIQATALQHPDGACGATVVYAHDVTARRRIEQDLARRNAELRHYVDAVSHDLQSPLMSLMGFTRLLDEDYSGALDDKGRHFLRRIEEAGRTMEDLLESLLELSRIQRTGPIQTFSDPVAVLRELSAEIKRDLDERDADLHFADDMPAVQCPRTRLYQILSNLVGNALDHVDAAEPRIDVSVEPVGTGHQIRVRDNGAGVPEEHRERIFEMFQSLGPGLRGRRTNGMGLAIVSKIAETQGGRAWVESEGQGATFVVHLPAS
ncbi:MAG: ATP-binding protein [Myxococcota bacterium]|nr:ATP-binding protein [Myxococcota bacterium]